MRTPQTNANFQVTRTKYRDSQGNVYGIEKTVRTGHWMVIRTNDGGHRKAVKEFGATTNHIALQVTLDSSALARQWKAVSE